MLRVLYTIKMSIKILINTFMKKYLEMNAKSDLSERQNHWTNIDFYCFFMIYDFCKKTWTMGQKGCQNGFKMDEKSSLGRNFWILGDLLRWQIFDRFPIEKKSSENQQNGGRRRSRRPLHDFWGRGRRRVPAPEEVLESDFWRIRSLVRHAQLPRKGVRRI